MKRKKKKHFSRAIQFIYLFYYLIILNYILCIFNLSEMSHQGSDVHSVFLNIYHEVSSG